MRVLVTGYRGYVGPILVRELRSRGYYVVGLDTGYFADCAAPPAGDESDETIVADMRRLDGVALDGVDAIIHLAALSNDPLGKLDPGLTRDINTTASLDLAQRAKAAGVGRFVFASSCSLYGAAGAASAPLDEQAPFNPVSAYAESKVATELGLRDLADGAFSPVALRFATAFGASPRMRFDLVVNNLMAWARLTGEIRVLSDGTPWRPLVHVEDMASAMIAAATGPREAVHNQAFNIGRDDANYQVVDIARAVAAQVPGAKLVITGETGGDARSYRVDFGKAKKLLPEFSPRWTLADGCAEIDRWLAAARLAREDFEGRVFVRLKQLEHLRAGGRLDRQLYWT